MSAATDLLELITGTEASADGGERRRPLRECDPRAEPIDLPWIEKAVKLAFLLEAGEFSRHDLREITRLGGEVIARGVWDVRRSSLLLFEVLISRDTRSARELASRLREQAAYEERALARAQAPNKLPEAMEALGISDEELAEAEGVKVATVRRWKRGGGSRSRLVPVIVEIYYLLAQRGLQEEAAIRAWMDTPNEHIDGATPRERLLSGHETNRTVHQLFPVYRQTID